MSALFLLSLRHQPVLQLPGGLQNGTMPVPKGLYISGDSYLSEDVTVECLLNPALIARMVLIPGMVCGSISR